MMITGPRVGVAKVFVKGKSFNHAIGKPHQYPPGQNHLFCCWFTKLVCRQAKGAFFLNRYKTNINVVFALSGRMNWSTGKPQSWRLFLSKWTIRFVLFWRKNSNIWILQKSRYLIVWNFALKKYIFWKKKCLNFRAKNLNFTFIKNVCIFMPKIVFKMAWKL